MLSQDKVLTNQNQYLSFSLTSMLEESTYNQDLNTKRRKEHLKQLSDLSIHSREEQKVVEPKSNRNKDQSYHFKKFRKEIVDRLEINLDQKPSMLNLNPMKTPIGGDRKVNLNKTKNSKSKRKDEDKENADVKHSKKKSKKISQVHQE